VRNLSEFPGFTCGGPDSSLKRHRIADLCASLVFWPSCSYYAFLLKREVLERRFINENAFQNQFARPLGRALVSGGIMPSLLKFEGGPYWRGLVLANLRSSAICVTAIR